MDGIATDDDPVPKVLVFTELAEPDSKLTSEDVGMSTLPAVVVKLDGTATDDAIVACETEMGELTELPGFADTLVSSMDVLVELVALLDIEAVGRLTMSGPDFDASVFSKVTFVTGFDELNCVSNVPDDVGPVEALDVTNEEELEGRGDLVEVLLLITAELEETEV